MQIAVIESDCSGKESFSVIFSGALDTNESVTDIILTHSTKKRQEMPKCSYNNLIKLSLT